MYKRNTPLRNNNAISGMQKKRIVALLVLMKVGEQKLFCSPTSGPPNPRRLMSATPIGVSRASGAVPSGLWKPPPTAIQPESRLQSEASESENTFRFT